MKRTVFSKMTALLFVLTLLASMITVVPFASAAGVPEVAAGSATAVKGATATVPLTLTSGSEVSGFNMSITYDASQLEIVDAGIVPSAALQGLTNLYFAKNIVVDGNTGTIYLAVANGGALSATDEAMDLFDLTFTVKADATAGDKPLTVAVEKMVAPADGGAAAELTPTVQNGNITVVESGLEMAVGSATVNTTSQVIVPVTVTGGSAATELAFTLSFDPAKYQLSDETAVSDFIASLGDEVMVTGNIDNTAGTVSYQFEFTEPALTDEAVELALLVFEPATVADGDVINLTFTSTSALAGETALVVTPDDGTITVVDSADAVAIASVAALEDVNYYTYEKSLQEVKQALPKEVDVTLEGTPEQTAKVQVLWADPAPAYDNTTAQAHTFTGTLVNLPADITNPNNLQATITVRLSDRVITAVTEYPEKTVSYGTAFTSLGLPTEVTISAEGGYTGKAQVAWNVTDYSATRAMRQQISGTLTLPDGVVQKQPEVLAYAYVTVQPQENGGGGVIVGPGGNTGSVTGDNGQDHTAYMNGYPDSTFRPNGNITRAEVAAVVHRVMGSFGLADFQPTTQSYSDVSSSHWAYQDIEVLSGYQILSGYPDGTFRPSDPITRAEFAKVITTLRQMELVSGSGFVDVVGHWAESYIYTANKAGFMIGYGANEFRPQNNLTRAETVTTINRMLGRAPEKASIDRVAQNVYTDVDSSHWAYYEIMEASLDHKYTILNGVENWYKLA